MKTTYRNSDTRNLACVMLLAAVVRTVALVMVFPPRYWEEFEYGFELGRVAANFARGVGLSGPFPDTTGPTAWFCPLVPVVWAGLFRIFGEFSPGSLIAVYSLQIAARAAAAGVYYLILCELGRRTERLSARAESIALAVSLAIILWPDHFIVRTRPWYWAYQELGIACMCLWGIRWIFNGGRRAALRFGIASGCTLLVNATPVVVLCAILVNAAVRARTWGRYLREFAVVGVVVCMFTVPWLVRNYVVIGGIVPLRSNFGVELLQGNNERATLVQNLSSLHPNVDVTERTRYRELGERAYVKEAHARATSYMVREQPGRTVQRTVMRILLFWITDLFHEGVYADGEGSKVTNIAIAVQAVVPLCVFSVLLVSGVFWKIAGIGVLMSVLLLVPVPHYLTHVHPTYTSVVKPYLLLVCGIGIAWWYVGRRSKKP
jgi:hypothetical protein